jgi:hypothetical protein
MRRLVIFAVVTLSGTAVAQPALTPPVAPAPPPAELPHKDEATATMLAIGGTAVGVLALYAGGHNESEGLLWLGIAGLTVGPSAGHIYAGENGHALGASLLRAGGMLMFGLGVIALVSSGDCIDDAPCDGGNGGGEALLWVGGLTFAVTTLYDIIDASSAARRVNAKHARAWNVAPTVVPAANGPAPAVSLIGRF